MPDNFTVDSQGKAQAGSYAADDIAGVKYPRNKVSVGPEGAAADWEGEVQPGLYEATPDLLGDGERGPIGLTAYKAGRVMLEDSDGTEGGTDTNPTHVRQRALQSAVDTPGFYTLRADKISGAIGPLSNTTPAPVIAAQGATVAVDVTKITITNAHATVGTVVEIRNGATVKWVVYAAPAGGGVSEIFVDELVGVVNTAWNAVCLTTGSAVYVSMSGHKVTP